MGLSSCHGISQNVHRGAGVHLDIKASSNPKSSMPSTFSFHLFAVNLFQINHWTVTMGACRSLLSLFYLVVSVFSLRWDPAQEGWNLNLNQSAVDPLDYWGEWENHTFHPSPRNWRIPFYCLTLDRFVDGDPTNNEANGTRFEHDWTSNQFRFGGDAQGLRNNLDYIQGMGIKVCQSRWH